jgi:SET domain
MKELVIESKYLKVSSFAEIREAHNSGHKSLHAMAKFEPNEVIASFVIDKTLTQPDYLTIQAGEEKHCMIKPEYLHYINHGCNPNAFFDMDRMILICINSIEIGDEFTFLYPSTDWQMIQPFKCLGLIRGASYLTQQQLREYKLSDFIKQKLENKSFI